MAAFYGSRINGDLFAANQRVNRAKRIQRDSEGSRESVAGTAGDDCEGYLCSDQRRGYFVYRSIAAGGNDDVIAGNE